MQSKEIDMIIKILGILGVVFCLVALLTPWGYGAFTFGLFETGYSTPFYIDVFTNQIFQSYASQVIFFGITMIIIFIIILITLILSITTIKNIQKYPPGRFLTLGILLLITFILYIIAVSVLSSSFGAYGMYSVGFIMALIGAIMFFIAYAIKKYILTTPYPLPYQQPMYTQPQTQYYQQQPQQTQPIVQEQQYTPPPMQPTTQPTQRARQTRSTSPRFCPQCGSPLPPNVKFCPECGNKLE